MANENGHTKCPWLWISHNTYAQLSEYRSCRRVKLKLKILLNWKFVQLMRALHVCCLRREMISLRKINKAISFSRWPSCWQTFTENELIEFMKGKFHLFTEQNDYATRDKGLCSIRSQRTKITLLHNSNRTNIAHSTFPQLDQRNFTKEYFPTSFSRDNSTKRKKKRFTKERRNVTHSSFSLPSLFFFLHSLPLSLS